MAAKRHHTVSRFLLERFARVTDHGVRICQLEVGRGATRQVSPGDAAVRTHFYSIDVEGKRSPIVEDAVGKVESITAPIVRGLGEGRFPDPEGRAALSLFIAMAWLRTPRSRHQAKSNM